jgi:hypothetical protein
MEGGISEAKVGRTSVTCRNGRFGGMPPAELRRWKATEWISIGSGYSLAQSEEEIPGKPYGSRAVSEVKSVKILGGLSLKHCLLTMQSSHDVDKANHPSIKFGKTEITGLRLGKTELKITLDLDTFNKFPTMEAFEAAFQSDAKLRAALSPRFLMNGTALHKSKSGYVMGSLVKKIEGLPKDAKLLDAYTIFWPPVGRIVLGEVLMGPHIRRVTMLRVKDSCGGVGSGCNGGGGLP